MPKKGKGKGRGKGKSQDDPQKDKDPPKKEQPAARPPEGAAKGKGKSEDDPQTVKEPPRRDQPATQSPEEAAEGKEKGDIPIGSVYESPSRKQPKSLSPEGGIARGVGRGRGRGRIDPSIEVQRPGGFFEEIDKTKVEYQELSASAAPKPVKDVSCRPKVSQVSAEFLSEMTGLSLEQKPTVKYKMATRANYGQVGTRIELYVNYFKLEYKNTSMYHYDVDILEATKDKKMGESLMSKGRTAKEDIKKQVKHVERQKRRNIGKKKCRLIIAEMIKSKELRKYCPVYDGQKNLFTSKPLPYKEKISFPVNPCIDGEVKQFYVTIQPVNKNQIKSKLKSDKPTEMSNLINLQPLIDLYSGRSKEIPEEVLLVYDTIMNHREPPFKQVQFRNSFFSLTGDNVRPLGCGLDIWFGYHQSVHLTEVGPVVVINLAAKAFHKAGPVIDYACDVLESDITKLPKLQKWQIGELSNALKGLQVKVTHQKFQRKYKIKGLTERSAKELIVQDLKKSVADYFLQKYGKKLQYPNLPCLQMQTSSNTTFIPMETCVVMEGQPKIGKLSGELTSKMIRSTAVAPENRFESIQKDARKVKDIGKQFMDAFSLLMDVNLMKVDGRIIASPKLAYKDKDGETRTTSPDNRGVWRVEDGKKFYRKVIIKKWVLVSFADERRFGMNVLSKYCDFLTNSGNKCGMQMDRPHYIKSYGRNVKTEFAINEAKMSGADFAIVVLNRRDNFHSYVEVKFLSDFKYGLVTQCMEDKTLLRINDQITTNVCLKINVKLGGINHILFQNPQILSRPVMLIGADTIHWTRGLGYPSIVSVVASVDNFASRYVLTCHTQRNDKEGKISQEIVKHEKMKEITIELIEAFIRENKGRYHPEKIVVFRDGVSDGQFMHALEQEVSGIQQASLKVLTKIVPITFICVQKRHQTRFRPVNLSQGAGKQRNVPPGTVVDRKITHPVNWDYFVCSHEGIQGTSKPAHYTVLHDDNDFKSDELQKLCYFLCHTYVRCTRSVSLPAPILYADLAAFRAKSYADLHIGEDDVSICSDDVERDFPSHVEEAIRSMKSFKNNMFYV